MSRYAENTSVTSDSSRNEIERTLRRYGADQFIYGWDGTTAVVGFRMMQRQVKFHLPLPNRAGFLLTPTGRDRSPSQIDAEYEKAVRQRWRALALVIKAKLEAVESEITEFEDEFMAHMVLPDGSTVAEHVRPAIAEAYSSGRMPTSMLAIESGR